MKIEISQQTTQKYKHMEAKQHASDGAVDFLFLPGSVFKSYTFLRICQFFQSCPFYWHIVADRSLL